MLADVAIILICIYPYYISIKLVFRLGPFTYMYLLYIHESSLDDVEHLNEKYSAYLDYLLTATFVHLCDVSVTRDVLFNLLDQQLL